jgi:hypothetical protein
MKLLVFNGSPRKGKSNTKKILDHFLRGFAQNSNNSFEMCYLMEEDKLQFYLEKLNDADVILIGFPLYVTSMPGIVKRFIEKMPKNPDATRKIIFFIQSGFPESYQVDYLEHYLSKLAKRLNYTYSGMIFKGMGASVEIMPEIFSSAFLRELYKLGEHLGNTGSLNNKVINHLKNPVKLPIPAIVFYKLFIRFGIVDSFTYQQLKNNGISVKESLSKPLISV